MKRLSSFLLVLALTLSLLPAVPLTAQAATEGYYDYTVTDGEATIIGCNSAYLQGNYTIPSTLGGYSVTAIGEKAFAYCSGLTGVTIPDTVTEIGREAFFYCQNLRTVVIPDSIETIPSGAFDSCIKLSDVTIPDSVTTIDYRAFYNCPSLSTVKLPDSLKTIGDYAFAYCTGLSAIDIPYGVSNLGEGVFLLTGLVSATIPNSVTAIGRSAFGGIENLTSIVIPDSVTSIGVYAFSECYYLTTVSIGKGLTTVSNLAFNRCDRLADVYYNGSLEQWETIAIGTGNEDLTGATIHIKRITVEIETDDGMQKYGSVSEAIEKCDAGSMLTLKDNTEENIAASKDISLDLNGFTVTGDITATDGAVITLKDSSTDDYSAEGGYGKITGILTGVEAAKGYMKITENGETSFHRLNLDTINVNVRAEKSGMYFGSQFGGDEVVKRNIVAYGTAMGAGKMPNFADKTYTRIDAENWMTGCDTEGNSRNLANGTVLQGILGKNSGFSANVRNSQMQIYSQAYVELADGTRILGDVVCYSLRDVFEGTDTINGIDQIWNTLNDTQKQPVLQLYADFQRIMRSWNIPNIKNAAK